VSYLPLECGPLRIAVLLLLLLWPFYYHLFEPSYFDHRYGQSDVVEAYGKRTTTYFVSVCSLTLTLMATCSGRLVAQSTRVITTSTEIELSASSRTVKALIESQRLFNRIEFDIGTRLSILHDTEPRAETVRSAAPEA